MRVLVNATNLVVGGGVQKAVQFVLGCANWGGDHQWRCLVSPPVGQTLSRENPPAHLGLKVGAPSPARIVAGHRTRRLLERTERDFRPDVVFSVSGPCYKRFAAPHLMGFAIPWLTSAPTLAWRSLPSPTARLKFRLRLAWYDRWMRQADAWVLQTESASRGLAARLGGDPGRFHVVPNGCGSWYEEAQQLPPPPHPAFPARRDGISELLVFTSYKPHKNLESIPAVARLLNQSSAGQGFRFVFTLDAAGEPWRRLQARARELGVAGDLVTVGTVPVDRGPALYAACDALYSPTLLEVFSANYPEAMAMGKPIITSDLPFARDVCGDAARYFDPTSAEDAASAVRAVCGDRVVAGELVDRGRRRLEVFGNGEERFRATVAAIEATCRRGGGPA